MSRKAKLLFYTIILSVFATAALAGTKLSQINNGGALAPATDQLVGVRSGTTDELLTPGTASAENIAGIIIDDGAGNLTIAATGVTNAMLAHSSMTLAGHSVSLGGTQTFACGDLSNAAASCSTDATSFANDSGTISSGTWNGTAIANTYLANSATTVNGSTCTLGSTCTPSAPSLSISGQTGLLSFTGLTSINRIKTVRDAADTLLELGGSYTPTGTWDWTGATVTWPTFNQNTTGSAAKFTTARTIAITGDLAYTSPSFDGSANVTAAGTLATVNTNTGSFGSSTAIPSFTVNGKGLITAASTNAVVAPAGTLSGSTLAAGVTGSSLTGLGTISSGVWQGTAIANTYVAQLTGNTLTNNDWCTSNGTIINCNTAPPVTSLSGDGTYITNSGSTGAVTLTTNFGLAAKENLSDAIIDNGSGSLTTGTGFVTNRFINGNFRIDQYNEFAAVTTASTSGIYGPDRWRTAVSTASVLTVQVINNPTDGAYTNGGNYLRMTTAIATTFTGSNGANVGQRIPLQDMTDLGWGSASAKNVMLDFWARSSLTGTFTVFVINGNAGRSYLATYSIPNANTWTHEVLSVPGDQSGTWYNFSNPYYNVGFDLGYGSGARGTGNTWLGAFDHEATGSTQVIATLGATLDIEDVRMYAGKAAVPFAPRPYAEELLLCRRFYRKTFPAGTVPAQNAGLAGALGTQDYGATAGEAFAYWQFDPPMNGTPTITTFNPSASNANWRDVTGAGDVVVKVDPDTTISNTGVMIGSQTTALTAGNHLYIHLTAQSEL